MQDEHADPPKTTKELWQERMAAQDEEEYGRDLILRAGANWRDRKMADLVVFALTMAAEQYPEILREAFAKVLGVEHLEQVAARAIEQAALADAKTNAMLRRQKHVEAEWENTVGKLDRQIGGLLRDMDAMLKRFDKASAYFKKLQATVAPTKPAPGPVTPQRKP